MPLSDRQAIDQASSLLDYRNGEQRRIERIHRYWRGHQQFYWLPTGVPLEVRRMAEISRVNVLKFIVDAAAQSMYVDGLREPGADGNEPVWDVWQANRMDARQVELHRSTLAYGAGYAVVLPGDPLPVIRARSPRKMTCVYDADEDWPQWAIEERDDGLYRLFDATAVYWLRRNDFGNLEVVNTQEHGVGVVPVVRFRDQGEIDGEVLGQVEPHIPLQDQINLTTFSLLVAQHYGAHRQRYIIGWLAESEEQALRASAQRLWTFEDDPDDVKIGEFEQTDLSGYIESREASLRHMAALSQTPVHEMLGQMANLSAEALVAARDSHNRKIAEHQTMMGESHEQVMQLAGAMSGLAVSPQAWVRWRDMEGRSLSQTADALGKAVESLGIPARAMWDRFAEALGASQQEVESWVEISEQMDPIAQMEQEFQRQASNFE